MCLRVCAVLFLFVYHVQGCTLVVINVKGEEYFSMLFYKRATEFELAVPTRGSISLRPGDKITLACTGIRNTFTAIGGSTVEATCANANMLEVSGRLFTYHDLRCDKTMRGDVRKTTYPCATHGVISEIGYQVTFNQWVTLIKVCYNDAIGTTYYTEHTLYGGKIGDKSKNNTRPAFSVIGGGSGIPVAVSYKQVVQKANFNALFNATLAETYINSRSYLVKGHLSPDADFVTCTYQRTTYFYINACPQWKSINEGNWKSVETSIRKTSETYDHEFTIITGTYGILTLPDTNNIQRQIYLVSNGNRVPVPELVWKIMYNQQTNEGIVFISVNNPYLSTTHSVCNNICAQYGWGTLNWNNPSKGYVYCCALDDFYKVIDTAPSLTVKGVLRAACS